MAFKRIVANSEEDLEKIVNHIKDWFKNTSNYTAEEGTEKRKFQDPDTKTIVEKDIDIIKVQEPLKDKNGKIIDYKKSTIKFIPMIEKGQMKLEISGEGETVIASKIKDQVEMSRTRDNSPSTPLGKLKSYSKDKKVALKENEPKPPMTDDELMKKIKSTLSFQVSGGKKGKPGLKEDMDKRIATIFLKYKGKSFPMDYKPGSMFSKFIGDLETSGYFSNDDEISDFMSSEEFDSYANKFNVDIDYADYDPSTLELAPEEPINPQDLIPGRAPQGFVDDNIPHRMTDLMEKLKKTGKLKKSELTEILLHGFKK